MLGLDRSITGISSSSFFVDGVILVVFVIMGTSYGY